MARKYLTIVISLILSIVLFIGIIILGGIKIAGHQIIPPEYISDFIVLFPGTIFTDILLIYGLPVAFFLIYYAISPHLIWVYIKVHKFFYRMLRRPSQYGVFKLGTKVKAGRLFYRALIVSLFAFSIAFLVVELISPGLFRANMAPESFEEVYALNFAEAVFLGTFAICPIIIVIFFPIWQLEDSGVVSYRVFHEERMPADIQGVHSIYNNMLLGYAGFSTILSWILLISNIFSNNPELGAAVLTPIIIIILPFLVTGILAIPIFLYERLFTRNNERLMAKLEGFDFPEIIIPHFEEIVLEDQ